jgi:hypothetical protein
MMTQNSAWPTDVHVHLNQKKMQQSRKLIWPKEGENFRMVDLTIPSTLIYLKLQELTGLAFTKKTQEAEPAH